VSKLRKLLLDALGDTTVGFIDIGARGGIPAHWNWLASKLHVTLFEPDSAEAEALRVQATSQGRKCTVVEAAVWNTAGTQSLNLTRSGACSSLLKPNRRFLDEFPDSERFDVLGQFETQSETLDDVIGEDVSCDFLKIDAQGGALMVLEGAGTCLEKAVGLEVEVEFVEMYEGEPLIGAVHTRLTDMGFELVDLRPNYWKRSDAREVPGCKGQAIFCDTLYMISPSKFADKMKGLTHSDVAQSLARLLACCNVYGLDDWMVSYISICRERGLIDGTSGFTEIERRCRKGGLLARLPRIPGAAGIAMVLMDLAFHLGRGNPSWVYQDNSLANMPRTRWTRWMRP